MKEIGERKKLRGYLKGYRMCLSQAKEIEIMIADGEVADCVRDELLRAKDEFILHCRNVQTIVNVYTEEGSLERRIFNSLYIAGKSMRQVAKATGYSYGHCANTEANAINRLCGIKSVMELIRKTGN